tara:strand:- start:95 stop:1324 length:1230 start_codon:yes stop_codon:yes gene_type:complete
MYFNRKLKSNNFICVAGKNSIAVSGLNYIISKYKTKYQILALGDVNDNEEDLWQPSFIKFAKEKNVPVVKLEDLYEIKNLCFISLEYFKLIDIKKFKTTKLFNIHFSLLPFYRGMYTSAHPILSGEKKTGCTFHKIDSGIDTGAIISQIEFEIQKTDNCKDVYSKYLKYGRELSLQTLDSIIEEKYETRKSLNEGSYYSKKSIDYNNLKIDFCQKSINISRQIRAYTFRDYQLPKIKGFKIFGHKILKSKSKYQPGKVILHSGNSITISTLDYDLLVYIDIFDKLLNAVINNDIELIQNLNSKNPFMLNEKNHKGWSPLIISAYNGYNKSTKSLLELGADPNITNSKGTSPLMYAKDYSIKTGDFYSFELLIRFGAKKNNKDIFNKTIFDYLDIKSKYHHKLIEILNKN